MVGREDETEGLEGDLTGRRSREVGGQSPASKRQEMHGASSDQDNLRHGAANRLTQQRTGFGSPRRNIFPVLMLWGADGPSL